MNCRPEWRRQERKSILFDRRDNSSAKTVSKFAGSASSVEQGKDNALAFGDIHLEISGRQQVFVRGVAAARLLGVLEVIEPVGCGDELGSRAGLQVEPRKAFVEAVAHAPRDGVTVRVGRHVRVGERMAATECEERPEPEPGFRARLEQRVTDQQLRAAVDPKQLLFSA